MSLTVSIDKDSGKKISLDKSEVLASSLDLRNVLSRGRRERQLLEDEDNRDREDLRSRLTKHKPDNMGIAEYIVHAKSKWDDVHHDRSAGDMHRDRRVQPSSHYRSDEDAIEARKVRDKENKDDDRKRKSGRDRRSRSQSVSRADKKAKHKHRSRSTSKKVRSKRSPSVRSRSGEGRTRDRSSSKSRGRRPLHEKSEKAHSIKKSSKKHHFSDDNTYDRKNRRSESREDSGNVESPDGRTDSDLNRSRDSDVSVKSKKKKKKDKKHKERSESKKNKKEKKSGKKSKKDHSDGEDESKAKHGHEQNKIQDEHSSSKEPAKSSQEMKGRKSRIDSGISTGSPDDGSQRNPVDSDCSDLVIKEKLKDENSIHLSRIEEESVNTGDHCSKVSDSPLSGTSLSPTPSPSKMALDHEREEGAEGKLAKPSSAEPAPDMASKAVIVDDARSSLPRKEVKGDKADREKRSNSKRTTHASHRSRDERQRRPASRERRTRGDSKDRDNRVRRSDRRDSRLRDGRTSHGRGSSRDRYSRGEVRGRRGDSRERRNGGGLGGRHVREESGERPVGDSWFKEEPEHQRLVIMKNVSPRSTSPDRNLDGDQVRKPEPFDPINSSSPDANESHGDIAPKEGSQLSHRGSGEELHRRSRDRISTDPLSPGGGYSHGASSPINRECMRRDDHHRYRDERRVRNRSGDRSHRNRNLRSPPPHDSRVRRERSRDRYQRSRNRIDHYRRTSRDRSPPLSGPDGRSSYHRDNYDRRYNRYVDKNDRYSSYDRSLERRPSGDYVPSYHQMMENGSNSWEDKVNQFLASTSAVNPVGTSNLVQLTKDSVGTGVDPVSGNPAPVLPHLDLTKPPPVIASSTTGTVVNGVQVPASTPLEYPPAYPSLGSAEPAISGEHAILTPHPITMPNPTVEHVSVATPITTALTSGLYPTQQPTVATTPGLVQPPVASSMDVSTTAVYYHADGVNGVSAAFAPNVERSHHVDYDAAHYRHPEIHTAVSVDESQERESKERDLRPLTAKEKKKVEVGQKEIWQYVARKLLSDQIFLSKRKKKKNGVKSSDEEHEDLKEKAEKCAVRIAIKLEKSGFSEARLWKMLKDNEKGVQGFYDELRAAVMSDKIEVDREAKKPKEKLDADLLVDGSVFRYIGEYIKVNPTRIKTGLVRPSSQTSPPRDHSQSLANGSVSTRLPSTNDLQSILNQVAATNQRPPAYDERAVANGHHAVAPVAPAVRPEDMVIASDESELEFATRTFQELKAFIAGQLVTSIQMSADQADVTAHHYIQTLAQANFNYKSLRDTITNYVPPEPEFEGEPVQSIYGHLLECLHNIPFDRVPRPLTESNLDVHQTNIVRLTLEYMSRPRPKSAPLSGRTSPAANPGQLPPRTLGDEEPGSIGPKSAEAVPVGGNTVNQLPSKRYMLVSVSVDTVPVDGRLIVWQISVHIPGLPDSEDPDYECLMVPNVLRERENILSEVGFTYDPERQTFYHHGTVFGRRRAESEETSLEKFCNYLDEIRSGLRGAGQNNGLVLLFETGEDLALVQQLLGRHKHDIFLDVVRGVTCLDHYLRVSRPPNHPAKVGQAVSYTWPTYQHRVGEGGKWTASVATTAANGGSSVGASRTVNKRIEAETKAECIYNICEALVGAPPGYTNFIKWFCYPTSHEEMRGRMTASLEHILELLPLQNHIDRQLFNNRVQVTLEGVFAARSEVEASRPHNACARQTIRRLVSLGFTLDVLRKSFRADPNYEIPSSVFLQDMTEVQKLRVHGQTDSIRTFIKHYFVKH